MACQPTGNSQQFEQEFTVADTPTEMLLDDFPEAPPIEQAAIQQGGVFRQTVEAFHKERITTQQFV